VNRHEDRIRRTDQRTSPRQRTDDILPTLAERVGARFTT
jgi:hypothetical protein